jgi:glycosidase
MNYPWLNAIIDLLKSGDTKAFCEAVMDLMESYPPAALSCLMNILSTHDTPRILNRLGADTIPPRALQADNYLSKEQREKGCALLKKAALLQFTLPGIPCIFYGDELGMEGYGDPYCRGTYPWGGGDKGLLEYYRKLGAVRQKYRSAFCGDCKIRGEGGKLILERDDQIRVVMNFSGKPLPVSGKALLGEGFSHGVLQPDGFVMLKI